MAEITENPQGTAKEHAAPETDTQISQEARFLSSLALACMRVAHDQWLGIVLYYEELKHNLSKLSKSLHGLKHSAQGALNMALIAAVLSQTPNTTPSPDPSLYELPNPDKITLLTQPHSSNSFIFAELSPAKGEASDPTRKAQPENLPITSTPRIDDESALLGFTPPSAQTQEAIHLPAQDFQTTNSPDSSQAKPQDNIAQLETPTTIRLDLLSTHEAYLKYGPYALSGPSLVHPDVVLATVRLYRGNDEHADDIAYWVNFYSEKYGMNVEVAMTAFMIQEGSFGKVTGDKSGDYNIGNIRSASAGEFLNFRSYQQGVGAVFWQIHRYDKVWPKERNDDTIHNLDRALEVYAPSHENPTSERITVAKEFINGIRLISDQYEKGEISKEQLQEQIYQLRLRIQQKYKTTWI